LEKSLKMTTLSLEAEAICSISVAIAFIKHGGPYLSMVTHQPLSNCVYLWGS
jgi:hypothetical protein